MTREEIIKAIHHCIADEGFIQRSEGPFCAGCPYEDDPVCAATLKSDIQKLLKAQEPRVMMLEEVQNAEIAWIEQVGELVAAIKVATSSKNGIMNFAYTYNGGVFYINIRPEYYGKISRCWTSRPTDEQREAEPWSE